MQFLRVEFQVNTPILHNTQFISGHYFHRYFNHSTRALGIIVDTAKWDVTDKSDYFAPYTLPARYHYEQFNALSRVAQQPPLFFESRKIYTLENVVIMDLLNPTPKQLGEFQDMIRTTQEFQFGGKETNGNGLCRYKSAQLYDYDCPYPTSTDFLIEFMSDLIPRRVLSSQDLTTLLQSCIAVPLPDDFQLVAKSYPEFEKKQYYIKDDMTFQVVPQHFLMHFQSNYPQYNKLFAEAGLRGLGQLTSAGFGKFRLRDPSSSPLHYHGSHVPPVMDFSEEERQFLKALLLHDLVPKVGGIEFLTEYYETNPNLSGLLLTLHYEWHERREKGAIKLTQFLTHIQDQHGARVAALYYKLALADQLAAQMTRVRQAPTYSRYLVGHPITDKVDLLSLSQSLIPIESPFMLWKRILHSPELAALNEALAYGDQPLSTHLILTLNFGVHLIRGKPAYIVAKVVPASKKQFEKLFWYKIFNITQKEEVYMYVIEEQIPEYPAALVSKILVKSIRPESCWLRIQ